MKINYEYLNMNFMFWRVECITILASNYLKPPGIACLQKICLKWVATSRVEHPIFSRKINKDARMYCAFCWFHKCKEFDKTGVSSSVSDPHFCSFLLVRKDICPADQLLPHMWKLCKKIKHVCECVCLSRKKYA